MSAKQCRRTLAAASAVRLPAPLRATGDPARPKEQYIKIALAGVPEHSLELLAVAILGRLLVNVFLANCPSLCGCKLSQCDQLVGEILPLIPSRDSHINATVHGVLFPRSAKVPALGSPSRSRAEIAIDGTPDEFRHWSAGFFGQLVQVGFLIGGKINTDSKFVQFLLHCSPMHNSITRHQMMSIFIACCAWLTY